MKLTIDATKDYGVVLEGGGAKGAYQIGVWKALIEAGIRIRGLAGTSVGGLNAAFICMGDWEKAKECWDGLTYSSIISTDDSTMDKLLKGRLPLTKAVDTVKSFVKNKGYDVTPLKELIADNVDGDKIRSWPGDIVVMSFNLDTRKEEEISLKDKTDDQIHDYLLATANMAPVFKTEELQGSHYIDGGYGNNVPVDVLIRRNYKDIIVIRIFGIGLVKNTKIPEDVHVTEICPHKDLGSIMGFTEENSHRNIVYGYYSAMRVLYGLKGRIFYFDETDRGEDLYLSMILSMVEARKTEMVPQEYLPGGESEAYYLRHLLENVLPGIARELLLGDTWNYQTLFLSVLENTAEILGIDKWHIYTAGGLLGEIRKAMPETEPSDFPKCARLTAAFLQTGSLEDGGMITDTIPEDLRLEMKGDYT